MNDRIFVGNLKYEVTDDELRDAFAKVVGAAEVTNVEVIRDRNGRAKFAFIEVSDARIADAAIEELQGFEIRGRKIRCEPAKRSAANEFGGDRNRESADHARPGARRWA
jgi:RNA recognition motif-containing protein